MLNTMRRKINQYKSYENILKQYNIKKPLDSDVELYLEYDIVKNKNILDIGAGKGDFNLFFSKLYNNNVISFEPLLKNYYSALKLFRKNKFKFKEQNWYAGYIGNKSDKHFSFNDMLVNINFNTQKYSTENFRCYSDYEIKDELHNINFDLIKIDVEGDEINVLNNIKYIIEKNFPKLIIEVHSYMLKQQVINFLEPYNYKIKHQGNISHNKKLNMDYVSLIWFKREL